MYKDLNSYDISGGAFERQSSRFSFRKAALGTLIGLAIVGCAYSQYGQEEPA